MLITRHYIPTNSRSLFVTPTDTQKTEDVPDERKFRNIEKGEDKDPNPLAPPINTQGGS